MINISSCDRANTIFFDRDAEKENALFQNTSVQVWLFGDRYLSQTITPVKKDGSVSYLFDRNVTDTMTDQQYTLLFVYQEKMQPSEVVLNTSTGCAVTRTNNPTKKFPESEIFYLDRITNTRGLILGEQFIHVLNQSNIRYERISIRMSPDLPVRPEYWIDIAPIGEHGVNEEIYVTGTTNLPVGSALKFFTYRSYFCPGGGCLFVGPAGNTTVLQDTSANHSYKIVLNGSAFPEDDEFAIEVESMDESIGTSEIFSISPG